MVYFVPRIKDRSAIISEARSSLTGRIVDSYTNIPTLKLFAHTDREDDYARESITDHTRKFHDQQRLITLMEIVVWTINGALIVATIGLALWLWSRGLITIGVIALTARLVIRINNMAGWVMFIVTSIFENIGIVQEGMETISRPHGLVDVPGARPLSVTKGEIRFEHVRFGYGLERGIVDDLSLTIHPGEKVGVVGRSGAGKSTLVNLLLRFYDLESGRILIDDQDISRVTQDSLRAKIGMVTQDTSLLHRSIMENILYVLGGGWTTALLRAFTAVPMHALCSGMMGFYIGQAKFASSKDQENRLQKRGLWIAVGIHGSYDFLLFIVPLHGLIPAFGVIPILIGNYIALRKKIKSARDEDKKLGRS